MRWGRYALRAGKFSYKRGKRAGGSGKGVIYILKCESSAVHRGEADRESICKIKWPIAYVHWGLRRAGG